MSEIDTMKEIMNQTTVNELLPLGFGNPESSISRVKQLNTGELTPELEDAAAEIIMAQTCLVEVTERDDGCIDGRAAVRVSYIDKNGERQEASVNMDDAHERAKVAGGGYLTSLAMQLALHPPAEGIERVLSYVVRALADKGMFCGFHTGDHQKDDTTDCGANDKFETILTTALTFHQPIADVTGALVSVAGASYDADLQQKIYENWSIAADAPHVFEASTGQSRSDTIFAAIADIQHVENTERPVAVSKHLEKDHKEDFIIINFVTGKTFSQAELRRLLKEQFPDVEDPKLPQAFVVDAWRIAELAEALSHTPDENQLMLQAGVSYQLATAATLTDGSLRVFVIK